MNQKSKTQRFEILTKMLKQSLRKVRISKDYFKKYPEALLQIDYAMVRFVRNELGFKIKQGDPKVWFAFKRIPEKKQLVIHLRMPAKDKWNNILEFLDIDIYFPQDELEKVKEL